VAITGSSGFAGSHTAAALIRAGHDARVLVPSPDKLEGTLAPHGVATPEVVTGDVTDPGSVDEALDGADGLIHAANMFTFDVRKVHEMKRINEEGTKLVLGRAAKRNLDPIVHVSSSVALLPASGPPTEDSPIGNPDPTMRQPRREPGGPHAGCRRRVLPSSSSIRAWHGVPTTRVSVRAHSLRWAS